MGWMSSSKTTSTSLDPVQRSAIQENLNWARYAANQPFQQYQGPWTAAWRPELQQAGGMIQNSAGVGTGELNRAAAGARSTMSFRPQMVNAEDAQANTGSQFMGQYFNPFLSRVAGNVISDMGRARQMQILSDEDKALAAHAYGGSRHGIVDSESNRSFFDTLGKNLSSLYAGGFDTAARLGMADADRFTNVGVGNADRALRADQGNQQADIAGGQLRLDSARTLAGVGDTMHDNYLDSATGLMRFGSLAQDYDQQQLDRDRERFNEWRDYPARQAAIINAAVSGMPNMGSSTTERKDPSVLEQIGAIGGLFF